MSLSAEIPFWVTRLELVGGTTLIRTPLFPEISWLTHSAPALATAFTHATTRRWTKHGEVLPWLDLTHPLKMRSDTLDLTLSAPPDGDLPSPLVFRFHILIGSAGEDALIGFVPALSIGGRGADEEALRRSLVDAIKMEFARKKRLKTARGVLSSQWFANCELIQTTATAHFYTFSEVRTAQESTGEIWLPQLADRLQPNPVPIFEVEDTLNELTRAFESPHATCIVLVGPSGVGKSALIEALASGRPDDCLWRTSAAAMIRGLTSSGGWQDNLAQLCEELAESRDWLVVQNLPELFEVGRYVGNSTSMAESLRPLISRGGLRLITECTSEQAARLESRYPGFLDPFVQITIEEPTDLPALLTKRAAREAGRIPVAPGSVETLLRLLRRFSPYSGFPGRAVRFIEATCRAIREQGEGGALDSETVFSRFCAETGMPRALIDPATPLAIADIEAHFQKWIFGQPEAVAAVVDTLISVRAALTRPRRPIATLLFAGPTGVGKTETAKALAAFMFGSPDRMIRFDMSEFSSPGAALRLSDGPGGEGRLTGAIRRQPFSVLLLDEIEKADGMVFDLLLQVLGEGRLTDGQGRTADFCSSIVIMTSNIGARDAARPPSGFSRGGGHIRRLPEIYTEAVEKHFRPEFFNRIDRVVAFSALQPDAIASVLDRELSALSDGAGLRRRRASLDVSPQAQQHLITIGYNPAFGARHLQRALRRHLSAPVSAALNAIVSENPLTIHITESDGTLICDLEEHRQDRRAATAKQRLEEAADAIDDARRTARKVIAGAAFAELRSSLSILRRRRKRLKQSFWARSADVARLGRLEQIEADCRQMADEIADLSLKTDLSIMAGDGEAQPLEVALAEHTMHARQVRRALYEALSLDEKTIIVGVYGSIDRVAALIEVYIQAAESMGMPVKAADLWLRRDASTILPGETPAADGSTSPYLLSPPHDHRKEGVSVHVGVELRISGAGVASIFDGEEGILCWIEPTEHRVLVRVEAMDRPDYHRVRFSDLHRQSAVKGRPRLTFQDNQVTGHSKNATMLASDYADAFVGLLTERFHEHVLKAATQ